jgi:hypothetical protein
MDWTKAESSSLLESVFLKVYETRIERVGDLTRSARDVSEDEWTGRRAREVLGNK